LTSEAGFRDIPVLLLYNLDPAWSAAEIKEVAGLSAQLSLALAEEGHTVTEVPVGHGDLASILAPYDPAAHIVFNWCESYPGIARSEPQVARDLAGLGYLHTGADATALALSQDKCATKAALVGQGVPTPAGELFTTPDVDGWSRYPAIVKTACEHCSEGLTRDSVVSTPEELSRRIDFVLRTFRQPALVEDFIDGREFHVTLIGNGHPEMLPVAEMDFSRFGDFHDHLCSYEAKFTPGSAHYEGIETLLPAPLGEIELYALEQVSRAAYQTIGCRDYGRIDVRLRDGVYHVLDVNPNSDLSFDASTACAAEVAGIRYGQLASRILGLAVRRSRPG
jgi:D-alanine-D-alanine ligase